MASTSTKEPKKEPALKDLHTFTNSRHLVLVMADAISAHGERSKYQAPGTCQAPDPDIIKIDARNGKGVLMDYDVNLNMGVELNSTLLPYVGRPVEEVSYYIGMEQSPVGGLRISHKKWCEVMKTGYFGNVESHPVPPEVQNKTIKWLLGLNAYFSLHEATKTMVQDIIDARMGGDEGEKKKSSKKASASRWEVVPLESLDLAELGLDLD